MLVMYNVPGFSGAPVTVVHMVSQSRSVSSRPNGVFYAAARSARSTASGSTQRAQTSASASHRNGSSRRSGSRRSPQPGNTPHRKNNSPRKSKHLVLKIVLGLIGLVLVAGIGGFAYLYATTDIPKPESVALAAKTTVYYADGTTELGSFAEQNREIISCDTLPKHVGQAIVSSENRSFYTDKGIDLKGIARALVNNIRTGSRQGGSTITQQYAERYYLGETTSYSGKLHEAILAMKIAQTQDKDEVLCNYMNTIYLGRGAYGIQAAAKTYFNKDAKDLTVPESALLAGIIPSPSTWDPAENPKQAESRYERVITIMQEDGYISSKEAKAAIAAKAPQTADTSQQDTFAGPQGYLLEMVRSELTADKTFTKEDLDTGGYKITTTIDKAKQDLMFQVASPSQGGAGIVPDGLQVGSMSVNPKDGSIISLYAGDDYLTKQLNNATQALYEPGSTMKPFGLIGAIQNGVNLSTSFNGNSPRTFTGIADPVQNFDNASYGYIDLYNATANSVNTVYMDVQQHLGAKKVAQIANAAGISDKRVAGDNAFTILGNDGVYVQDIAQAYATIANQGNKPTLHIVANVKDSSGKDMYKAPSTTTQVFDANTTALVAKAMTGTVQYGSATEALGVGKTIAAKTGTANDATAGSVVGFTPNTVSVFAIWYPDANGNPQEIPYFSGYTGGSDYPVHLFTQYMTQALAGTADEAFPTATDNGKIGGSDGTWGTGARTWRQQQDDAAKKKAEEEQAKKDQEEADKKKAEEEQREQEEEDRKKQSASPSETATAPSPGDSDKVDPPNGKGTNGYSDEVRDRL